MIDNVFIRDRLAWYMITVHKIGADRLPLQARISVAGANGLVSTNHPSVLGSIGRWLAPNYGSVSFGIDVLVDAALQPSSAAPAFRGMGHLAFASFGNDMFGFDLLRRRISGVVCQQTAADDRFWQFVLLPIAIGVMGSVLGVVPMHCACLEWKGEGVLITGASGAGKSTLAAAMAQYGFTFLSDDWTYVSDPGGRVVAQGLNVPLKLLPDAKRFFSLSDRQLALAMNGEWAYEVEVSKFGAKTKTATEPKRLLLLERSERKAPHFDPVNPQLICDFFERSSERLPACLHEAQKVRSRIIDRVANLGCWRFRYSGSPHEAANAIRYFLEQ